MLKLVSNLFGVLFFEMCMLYFFRMTVNSAFLAGCIMTSLNNRVFKSVNGYMALCFCLIDSFMGQHPFACATRFQSKSGNVAAQF